MSTEPARYRLQLQGRLSADWSDWLIGAAVEFEGAGPVAVTTVIGTVRDQASLFGLLSFIRDMGAPLIAVTWLPVPPQDAEHAAPLRIECPA